MSRTSHLPSAPHAAEGALKPIGFALAAVVAGLAPAGAAEFEPTSIVRADPGQSAQDPAEGQDDSLLLGPSEAVDPFAEKPAPKQADLFDL